LLIYLFENTENALDVTKKLYCLCYTIAPSLIPNFGSLEAIAKSFDQTKQAFSKKLININKDLGLRARQQKSSTAVGKYKDAATKTHREAKAEKRKEYLKIYREAHRAENKEYQKNYWQKWGKARRNKEGK
jgi:hypothetical protein